MTTRWPGGEGPSVYRRETRTGRVPIGLQSDAVLAGNTVEIERIPQVIFRPETFVLPPDVARSFELVALLVGGGREQRIEPSPIPLTTFSVEFSPKEGEPERIALQAWTLDTCDVGMAITIRVRRLPQCYTHTDCWQMPGGHEKIGQTCATRIPLAFSGNLWGLTVLP